MRVLLPSLLLILSGCAAQPEAPAADPFGFEAQPLEGDRLAVRYTMALSNGSWPLMEQRLRQGCAERLGVPPPQVRLTDLSRETDRVRSSLAVVRPGPVISPSTADPPGSYTPGYAAPDYTEDVPVEVDVLRLVGICERTSAPVEYP